MPTVVRDGSGGINERNGQMIVVTRLNDSRFAINPDLIERIHSNPDTTLIMVDGAKFIVTESMEEVIERVAAYRARVIALAYAPPSTERRAGGRQLGLVMPEEDPIPEIGTDATARIRPRIS